MIVSNSKRFIFFAFNKTGSSSVQRALKPYKSRITTRWMHIRYSRRGHDIVFKHAHPAHVRPLISEYKWRTYFKFCFIRNPFDRLVSVYLYHRQWIPQKHPTASQLSFEDWVLSGGAGSALRLMSDYIVDDSRTPLVDFVGRYEKLDSDFAAVCDRLGINARLPHDNATVRDHYSKYYSQRTRTKVEALFAKDLERFEYEFESE